MCHHARRPAVTNMQCMAQPAHRCSPLPVIFDCVIESVTYITFSVWSASTLNA
jgi:hypothetical protein